MPVKNYLKTDEKQKLQNEMKYNEHPDIRERILILLLQNDGKTQVRIQAKGLTEEKKGVD